MARCSSTAPAARRSTTGEGCECECGGYSRRDGVVETKHEDLPQRHRGYRGHREDEVTRPRRAKGILCDLCALCASVVKSSSQQVSLRDRRTARSFASLRTTTGG